MKIITPILVLTSIALIGVALWWAFNGGLVGWRLWVVALGGLALSQFFLFSALWVATSFFDPNRKSKH